MSKYPVYIVSKGRFENPITAKCFLSEGVKFKIVVEPQEYKNYCSAVGSENVLELPFSNLGLGSFPARNFAWEDARKNGFKRHWLFDDNIYMFRRLNKGKRINCSAAKAIEALEIFTDRYLNIGISGFNYEMFVLKDCTKPFFSNVHVYSGLLIDNNMKFRWRLKYNEDVDLCLQVLDSGLCTVLFNAFMISKVSTTAKMKGGNQSELYQGNKHEKKVLKARSLEEVWPQYAKTVWKFNRPHHSVDWKKFFKQPLKRDPSIDWENLSQTDNLGMKLKQVAPVKSQDLKKMLEEK